MLEVSVVARAHAKWGERPMAFVILHPQRAGKWAGRHTAFERDLKAHARKTLPGFACPEWVEVVETLPVSGVPTFLEMPPFEVRRGHLAGSNTCSDPCLENLHGEDPEGRIEEDGRQIVRVRPETLGHVREDRP